MFKWLKKKKAPVETQDQFPTMDETEILQGIEVLKRRNKKRNKHHVYFFNAHISEKTIKRLRRKKYIVEVLDEEGMPGFKVSW